jgi:hypothetical protein
LTTIGTCRSARSVSALEASVAVDGEPLFTGTLLQPVQLAAGGDTRVEIEARTGFAAILGAIDRFTRQRSVRYEVTGSAVVQDGWRLPLRRSGELPGADLLMVHVVAPVNGRGEVSTPVPRRRVAANSTECPRRQAAWPSAVIRWLLSRPLTRRPAPGDPRPPPGIAPTHLGRAA